jgi:hypothetical protein
VYSKKDIVNNQFEYFSVFDVRQGFVLGEGADGSSISEQYGARNTIISHCRFVNVKRHAVYIEFGNSNTVQDTMLNNVGNNGGGHVTAQYPQIYFRTVGNAVVNTQSDRSTGLSTSNFSTPYVPEVSGIATYVSYGIKQISLGQYSNSNLAFRLPVSTNQFGTPVNTVTYKINYVYKSTSNNFSRTGCITVVADIANNYLQLSDDYSFAGIDTNGTISRMLDFTVSFADQLGDEYTTSSIGQIPYSLVINYTNTLAADAGYFSYSYTATM